MRNSFKRGIFFYFLLIIVKFGISVCGEWKEWKGSEHEGILTFSENGLVVDGRQYNWVTKYKTAIYSSKKGTVFMVGVSCDGYDEIKVDVYYNNSYFASDWYNSFETNGVYYCCLTTDEYCEDGEESKHKCHSSHEALRYSIIAILALILLCLSFCLCYCTVCCFLFLVCMSLILFGGRGRRVISGTDDEKSKLLMSINSGKEDEIKANLKINENSLEIQYDQLVLKEVIGAGGGGCVIYSGEWESQVVCIKMYRKKAFIPDEDQDFEDFEMNVMASVSHPNLLRWYGFSLKYPRIAIVMEYCENGDLEDCLRKSIFDDFKEKIRVLREITLGMKYLHHHKIVHRDLKPRNVLLDDNMVAKIMDFGLSRTLNADEDDNLTHSIGTSYFMAPELIRYSESGRRSYDVSVDIYSFSILTYIVLTKNFKPYGASSGSGVIHRVSRDPDFRPVIEDDVEELVRKKEGYGWLVDYMRLSWSNNPSERPTFSQYAEMFRKSDV